jgi:hypothetical protein
MPVRSGLGPISVMTTAGTLVIACPLHPQASEAIRDATAAEGTEGREIMGRAERS